MEMKVVELETKAFGGFSFYGDPFSNKGTWESENEIGNTRSRFVNYVSRNPKRGYSINDNKQYELHIINENTHIDGSYEIFVGEEVVRYDVPIDISIKHISSRHYVRVTLEGTEISGDWFKNLDTYLRDEGLEKCDKFFIQVYDDRYKGNDCIDDSVIDCYVPIKGY